MIKIIFTGGGSGGHTMPAFSMIEAIKKDGHLNQIDYQILYLGSIQGVEKEIADRNGIAFYHISTGKLRRYFSLKNLTDILRIIKGIIGSFFLLKKEQPDLIISTGGFVSVPPVIAGKLLKIPVIIHEQTVHAGLANRIASRFADKIALTFTDSRQYFPDEKCVLTGIPLRETIFNGDIKQAEKKFGFDLNKPVIYFTGGGLGCHLLNETALNILPDLLNRCNIIFQTGKALNQNDYDRLVQLRNALPAEKQQRFIIYDFVHDDLSLIFAVASLAVARSGAGTVNELMALHIPAIYIPLAIATNDEQYKNAQIPEKIGGAIIIREADLNPKMLLETINTILFTEKISMMKNKLKESGFINGTDNMLMLIHKFVK